MLRAGVLGWFIPANMCHALYNNQEWWQNGAIGQPDPSRASRDAILQEKNEKATWLELTRDFEGTATLLSEQHMCKAETKLLPGEQFMRKQRKEPRLQCWNHVEVPCSLPRGCGGVSKNKQRRGPPFLSAALLCSWET